MKKFIAKTIIVLLIVFCISEPIVAAGVPIISFEFVGMFVITAIAMLITVFIITWAVHKLMKWEE